MPDSYNGWPASPDAAAIGIDRAFSVLNTKPFGNGGFGGGVRSGDVATLFRYLITALHTRVESMLTDPVTGQLGYGCWGYEYRANVNNPSQLSCHASGTAIDYNAPRHANGTSVGPNGGGGWSASQYRITQTILTELGGQIRWLTSNDPMHFEIAGSATSVAAQARSLGGQPAPSNPTGPVVLPLPIPGMDDEEEMLRIAVADDSKAGAVFAFGPGRFIHVSDPGHLLIGQQSGLLPSDRSKDYHTSRGGLDVLRDLCVGNGQGKGDNLISVLPSSIATP
jgi:hypothetical protein